MSVSVCKNDTHRQDVMHDASKTFFCTTLCPQAIIALSYAFSTRTLDYKEINRLIS